jgi:hypothetical protein
LARVKKIPEDFFAARSQLGFHDNYLYFPFPPSPKRVKNTVMPAPGKIEEIIAVLQASNW